MAPRLKILFSCLACVLPCVLPCVLLGFAAWSSAFAESQAPVPIGGLLPDALLQGLNGPSRHLNAYRGRPLVINVWASWCGPCLEEMASLERLAWRNEKPTFAIIGISTDDYVDKAETLLKTRNATISHFIDTRLQMEKMLGASKLPLTVLVDADGQVLAKVYGAKEWDQPEALKYVADTFRKSSAVSAPLSPSKNDRAATPPS